MNISRTKLATIAISAAAFGDAAADLLFAVAAAVVKGGQFASIGLMAAETVGFAALMLYVVRPLVIRWSRAALRRR